MASLLIRVGTWTNPVQRTGHYWELCVDTKAPNSGLIAACLRHESTFWTKFRWGRVDLGIPSTLLATGRLAPARLPHAP
jgi:hypothetical protein